MEAITPTEIRMHTLWIEIPGKTNTKAITKDLDMADELREAAAIRIASYLQRMTNLYNRRVRPLMFRVGDLVSRRVFKNTAD